MLIAALLMSYLGKGIEVVVEMSNKMTHVGALYGDALAGEIKKVLENPPLGQVSSY
jgi:hypothetical protein